MERGRVRGLDGIRAFAALLVFAEHQIWPFHWVRAGMLGVEIFFVLSGYLIIGILTDRAERIEAGSATRRAEIFRFFVHRAFRIFPPYYALIAIAVVVALVLNIQLTYSLFPFYFTYTTNLSMGYYFQDWPPVQNFAHFWTLAIEEQFYVVMAPVFLCLSPRRHRAACITLIALAAFMALALRLLGLPWFTLRMDSLVNFGYLALGGLISVTTRPSASAKNSGFGLAGLVLAVIWAYCLLTRPENGAAFAVDVAIGAVSGIVIWQIVRNQQSRFVDFLEIDILRRIGKISYALYLVHLFIKLPPTGIAFKGLDLIIVANLLVSLALAQLSWWLIESPSLKFRDRVVLPWLARREALDEPRPEAAATLGAEPGGRQ